MLTRPEDCLPQGPAGARTFSPLLIVVALDKEAGLLIPRLNESSPLGRRPAYGGRIGGLDVRLAVCGLGTVNAAGVLGAALESVPEIRAVLNLGCAGVYEGCGLDIGDAALATELVHADSGVLGRDRLWGLEKIGLPLGYDSKENPLYNRIPPDPALSRSLADALPGMARGAFATVNQVSADSQIAGRIQERWGVIIEEMEGAALAQTALRYAKPFAALRGVSNICGQRRLDVEAGALAAQRAFLQWGENL